MTTRGKLQAILVGIVLGVLAGGMLAVHAQTTGGGVTYIPPPTVAGSNTWSAAQTFSKGSAATAPSFGQSASFSAASGGVYASFYGPTSGAAGASFDFYDTTNAALRGFIGYGTSTVTGDAVTDFAVAPGAGGSFVIGCANGASACVRVNGATGQVTLIGALQLPVTTVASLPSCGTSQKGQMYAVSDATTPTYNGTLTGGSTVAVPVFCNGSAWTAH